MTSTQSGRPAGRSSLRSLPPLVAFVLLLHSAVVLPAIQAAPSAKPRAYLPIVNKPVNCSPIPAESYAAISPSQRYNQNDPPAEQHPDLNLALRGYQATNAEKGLLDYGGSTDESAPQLRGLFANHRIPGFRSVYQVYQWDWANNRRGDLITKWPVTLAGLATAAGETIHVPESSYEIGLLANGYQVMVLYASPGQITLKYTREDNVIHGYTLHVEGICVEPELLALYQSLNAAGRERLPALRAGQAIGRASGQEIRVAVRDTGEFMDPRSRKDWWRE